MSLSPGTRLGPYEVVALLGRGGMGEVFRAHDSRLRRDVALKILPADVTGDPDRRSRFEREAQVLASLNHPSIAQLFGIEDVDGAPVIVMELVEGVALDELLRSRASGMDRPATMPIGDALSIARQLCDGLEAAHDRGIVHRDLKPANIKLRADGTVKILDFGLAIAGRPDIGGFQNLADSPTVLGHATAAGVILGTAAYMSPEQARGLAVDKRTDIWAFGCVLYEMLVGAPAFQGATTTDILAAIVQNEPDWTRLPAALPSRIGELLRRCLQKNPKDRLRDIADARFEIEQALRPSTQREQIDVKPSVGTHAQSRRSVSALARALWAVGGAAAAAALILLPSTLRPQSSARESPVRAIVTLPPDTTLALSRGSAVVLSPDGRRLVFAGRSKGKIQLYLRWLDRFEAQPIAGTDGAANPFFSPDGQWVGFFADGKLKKVSLDGGAPVALADAPNARGEAWGEGNVILFTPSNNTGLRRISALGGTKPEEATTLSAGEMSHRWPRFLPGGAAVLYSIWNDNGWEPARIVVKPLGGGQPKVIVPGGGGYARYVRDGSGQRGFLVYARSEGLLASRFDESRLDVAGQAVPVVDGVLTNLSGGAHFDISDTGTLVYAPGFTGETDRDLIAMSLDGKGTPLLRIHGMSRFWSLSPDGTRITRNNTAGPNRDVWIENLTTGASTRLTHAGDNFNPIWSADGKWILFARGFPFANMFRRPVDGSDVEERLSSVDRNQQPSSLSPDGASVLYSDFDQVSGSDIWVLPLPPAGAAGGSNASGAARPFIKTSFSEGNATFSPDGKWVVYQSNESGRFEIYVRPYPEGIRKVQISIDGGVWPVWSPTGREILFRGTNNMMMAAAFETTADPRAGKPRALFDASSYENVFSITPDGRRFLMMPLVATESSARELHVVVNFLAELRQRVK